MTPFVEKYKPLKLSDFAGMNRPKAILSAVAREPYASAWLLLGNSGLGKTCMALAFAEAIGGQVVHIPSRECNLERVREVCYDCHSIPMFARAPYFWVVIVDEADVMTAQAQLAFLSALDTTAAPPNTVFIFTANSTERLEPRFLSRVRTLRFSTDDLLEPGAALLQRIWQAETGHANGINFREILTAAGLNLRAAIMELEMMAMEAPRATTWACSCGETQNPQDWEICGNCGRPR